MGRLFYETERGLRRRRKKKKNKWRGGAGAEGGGNRSRQMPVMRKHYCALPQPINCQR